MTRRFLGISKPVWRILLTGAVTALWFLVIWAATAHANDCAQYVKDPKNFVGNLQGLVEDCMRTGYVQAIATLLAGGIGGGAIAIAVGKALGGGEEKKPEDEPSPGGRPDPCQASQDRRNDAALLQNTLMQAHTHWQGALQSLNDLYWTTSKKGYYSGVIDVGFLAGSVWGKALEKTVWKGLAEKYMADTLKQKLLEAAMKSFIKGSMKDYDKYMKSIYGKQGMDVGKKAFQEMFKQGLMDQAAQDMDFYGRSTNLEMFEKEWAGPLVDWAGNLMTLANMAASGISAAEMLEQIRGQLHDTRQKAFETATKLQAATDEMERARDDLQSCHSGDEYQKYLKFLDFKKLSSTG